MKHVLNMPNFEFKTDGLHKLVIMLVCQLIAYFVPLYFISSLFFTAIIVHCKILYLPNA